jgi:hypothetical protein
MDTGKITLLTEKARNRPTRQSKQRVHRVEKCTRLPGVERRSNLCRSIGSDPNGGSIVRCNAIRSMGSECRQLSNR